MRQRGVFFDYLDSAVPQADEARNRLHKYRRLSTQLILDMRPQDVVETRIGDKAGGSGPRGVEVSRPGL